MNIYDMLCYPPELDRLKSSKFVEQDWWCQDGDVTANSYHQQQPQPPQATTLNIVSSSPQTAVKTQQSQQQQPQTVSPSSTLNQPDKQPSQSQHIPGGSGPTPAPSGGGTFQTLRLRDDVPIILTQPAAAPAPRSSKKRKSPPTTPANNAQDSQNSHPPQHPPPPPPGMQHMSGPPQNAVMPSHALMQGAPPLPPHLGGPHPPIHAYQYIPAGDYTPGGMPPTPAGMQAVQGLTSAQAASQSSEEQAALAAGRPLSQSKRAEQNRKAQRAFRERRDQHVKALESRSQLLDAALASADEANRRWEDCRALVDQLRIENAALRVAINQLQQQLQANGNPANVPVPLPVSAMGQPGGTQSGGANDANSQMRAAENGDISKNNPPAP